MKKLEIINLFVGVVVLALLAFAGSYLQKLVSNTETNAILLHANLDCDLSNDECTAVSGKKMLTVGFSRPVKYLVKFEVTVKLEGFSTDEAMRSWIVFSMSDMDMGINRFELNRQENKNIWQGHAILPVCMTGRSDWLVRVNLQSEKSSYVANYKLVLLP